MQGNFYFENPPTYRIAPPLAVKRKKEREYMQRISKRKRKVLNKIARESRKNNRQ